MHVYWSNWTELSVRGKQPQAHSLWKREGKLREFSVSSLYFFARRLRSNWIGFVGLVSTYCVIGHGDFRFIYKQVPYIYRMEKTSDYILLEIWGQEVLVIKCCIFEAVHGFNASHLDIFIDERRWVRGIEGRGTPSEKPQRKKGRSWIGSNSPLAGWANLGCAIIGAPYWTGGRTWH